MGAKILNFIKLLVRKSEMLLKLLPQYYDLKVYAFEKIVKVLPLFETKQIRTTVRNSILQFMIEFFKQKST